LGTKGLRITIDDNLADLGGKPVVKPGDVALFTSANAASVDGAKIVINQPGEYEVAGVAVYGIAARSHLDEEGQKNATMYKVVLDELTSLAVGHIYPELTDDQLEAIGRVDIMFVPVGGNGFTLDSTGALKLIKKVEPKLVIPTHYDTGQLTFPVPQQPLDQALKALGMEPKETVDKLRVKPSDLSTTTQLVVLK
jgi:L-ascorbate metabolism protein UlaG (beta-lactamase superfamily)